MSKKIIEFENKFKNENNYKDSPNMCKTSEEGPEKEKNNQEENNKENEEENKNENDLN